MIQNLVWIKSPANVGVVGISYYRHCTVGTQAFQVYNNPSRIESTPAAGAGFLGTGRRFSFGKFNKGSKLIAGKGDKCEEYTWTSIKRLQKM